jgi:hypothetical protein
MSEHSPATTETTQVPFTPTELKQFDADDSQAGAAIGKMLSWFFLYTVIAMSISAFATYMWVNTETLK